MKRQLFVSHLLYTHLCWFKYSLYNDGVSFQLLAVRFALMFTLFVQSPDNQEGSDWRDEDEKLPGHENLTEKDIELFRHIQELALQVYRLRDIINVS